MIPLRMQAFLRRINAGCIVLLILAAVLPGCGDEGTTNPPPPDDIDYDAINPVIFSQHIQPIFTVSCNTAACHNDIDAGAGLRLTSYSSLAQGSTFGSQVIPFRPDRSHLYLHLTGDLEPLMPLALDPLPDDVIRMFKRWIEAGAPNDGGAAMYSGVTRKIFVACQGENAIAVLDLDTSRLIRIITVDQPHSIFVDTVTERLYVTRFETASNNVQIFDANTYELIRVGRAGTFPALLGRPSGTSQLWVTNFDAQTGDNRVRVLDPETLQQITSFDLPVLQPHGLAMSSDGKTVYVTNIGSSDISIFGTDPPRVLVPSIPLPTVAGIPNQHPNSAFFLRMSRTSTCPRSSPTWFTSWTRRCSNGERRWPWERVLGTWPCRRRPTNCGCRTGSARACPSSVSPSGCSDTIVGASRAASAGCIPLRVPAVRSESRSPRAETSCMSQIRTATSPGRTTLLPEDRRNPAPSPRFTSQRAPCSKWKKFRTSRASSHSCRNQ